MQLELHKKSKLYLLLFILLYVLIYRSIAGESHLLVYFLLDDGNRLIIRIGCKPTRRWPTDRVTHCPLLPLPSMVPKHHPLEPTRQSYPRPTVCAVWMIFIVISSCRNVPVINRKSCLVILLHKNWRLLHFTTLHNALLVIYNIHIP